MYIIIIIINNNVNKNSTPPMVFFYMIIMIMSAACAPSKKMKCCPRPRKVRSTEVLAHDMISESRCSVSMVSQSIASPASAAHSGSGVNALNGVPMPTANREKRANDEKVKRAHRQ
jgi:hypothetical protein